MLIATSLYLSPLSTTVTVDAIILLTMVITDGNDSIIDDCCNMLAKKSSVVPFVDDRMTIYVVGNNEKIPIRLYCSADDNVYTSSTLINDYLLVLLLVS